VLEVQSGHHVYNPPTVDLLCDLKEQLFFVESSYALMSQSKEDKRIFHAPWFLSMKGEWKNIDGEEWMVHGTDVYDVRGKETYMSRRSLHPAPVGYQWKDFSPIGTHWVTISSIHPSKKYGVDMYDANGKTLMTLDHAIPVKDVREVYADEHRGFDKVDGVIVQVFRPTRSQILAIPSVYETACGRMFETVRRSSAGLFFLSPDVLQIQNLHTKQVVPTQAFEDAEGLFVDCGGARNGMTVVIPDISDIDRVSPLLMSYVRRGHSSSVTSFVKNENAVMAEVSANEGEVKIRNYLSEVRIQGDQQEAPTVTQISRDLDLPLGYVHRVLISDHNYVYWRSSAGTMVCDPMVHLTQCQYVLMKNIDIIVPGQQFEGGMDGRTWSELLVDIGHVKIYESRSRKVWSFVKLLERNLFKVHVNRELDGHSNIKLTIISPLA
jgi:hypothetical protein